MEPRAEAGIFIGYSPETKGYKIVKDGQAKNFFISAPRDCTFKEDIFPGDAKQTEQESKEERSEIINVPLFWKHCDPTPSVMLARPTTPPPVNTQAPSTPPLNIPEPRYYTSTFLKDVDLHPHEGLRSGKDFHADIVEAINAMEEENLPEQNTHDEVIAE